MGISKLEQFNELQNLIATYAKALAHPARIAIIQHILSTNHCICNDLVEKLPLSQSTISQHLKELKSAGIIQGEIEGAKICYCINPFVWDKAHKTFENLFKVNGSKNECC